MAKRTIDASTPSARASKQARRLIEQMLQAMQRALKDPSRMEGEEWEKLFGPKQSMVVNLQKLVASLATLPEAPAVQSASASPLISAITLQEMALLKTWLEEARISPAD